MNIEKETTGNLEATLKVKLIEDDYREKVEKELKNTQKKVQMPGFRPGKVPMGMVKKLYGKSILAEEVNKIMADAVVNYIKEEKLDILGSPIPDAASTGEVDYEGQKEFEFHYSIGLKPEIDLELSEDIEMEYHKIIVPDERIDSIIDDNRKRHGKLIYPGVAEEDDVLAGEFIEVDEANNPIEDGKVNKTNVFIRYIENSEIKNELIGAKPGSQIVMDVLKAVDSETEAAAMVGVKKDELSQHSPFFRFTIDSISRIEPAEMNEDLYEKIAPGKEIKTEEELRDFLRDQLSKQYQAEVDKHFRNEVSEKLISITGLPLPESFLKKWLLENNKKELSKEKVEKEFERAADGFRWQLIENHLIEKYNIEVKPDEVNRQLELFIKAQLAQYGQQELPQEILDKYVNELKSKEEEVKKVYEYIFEIKLISLLKEKIKLHEKELSFEDFSDFISEKYKQEAEPELNADEAGQEKELDPDKGSNEDTGSDTTNDFND